MFSSSNNKLSAIFSLENVPVLRLPASLVAKVRAGAPKMGDFHAGMIDNMLTVEKGSLSICMSPEHDKKMIAFVTHGNSTVCAFGRMGLTNFAETSVLLDDGLPIFCSEQLFALYKTLFVDLSNPEASFDNIVECMSGVLFAAAPQDAKKAAGRGLRGLNCALWDSKSVEYMFYALLQVCKHDATFARYKHYAALLGTGDCKVYETNIDDKIWGIASSTKNFVDTLLAKAEDADFNLFEAAAAVAPGTNKLGELLTRFLLAIRDMSHADFMSIVGPIRFVEIVDDEDFVRKLQASV